MIASASRATAVLALSGCLVAACGGDDDVKPRKSTVAERRQIESVILKYVARPGGPSCSLLTEGFLKSRTRTEGAAALEMCRADTTVRKSADVKLRPPVIVGDDAISSVTIDDAGAVFNLKRDGDSWKINEITSVAAPTTTTRTSTTPGAESGKKPKRQTQTGKKRGR